MTSRTKHINEIVTLTKCSKHTLDLIGVNLGKAGLLPKGGRGLYAPDAKPEHIANLLIGLMASDKTKNAVDAVKSYSKLQTEDSSARFGEVLTKILSIVNLADKVFAVRLCRTIPEAEIIYGRIEMRNGIPVPVVTDTRMFRDKEIDYEKIPMLRHDVTLSPGVIQTMANQLEMAKNYHDPKSGK